MCIGRVRADILQDLLDLKLHEFADDVSEVVDQSVKEVETSAASNCIANQLINDRSFGMHDHAGQN